MIRARVVGLGDPFLSNIIELGQNISMSKSL
jgi:hypothetical protein